jgi:hypothetical protein
VDPQKGTYLYECFGSGLIESGSNILASLQFRSVRYLLTSSVRLDPQIGIYGGGRLSLQLPPDLSPQVEQGEEEGQLVLVQLLLSPGQNINDSSSVLGKI